MQLTYSQLEEIRFLKNHISKYEKDIELIREKYKKFTMKEKQYIAPMDLFGGKVKKGEIFTKTDDVDSEYWNKKVNQASFKRLPAEIVETWEEYVEDPFKDLKEAFSKGATIEFCYSDNDSWKIATTPIWKRFVQYRIKPEPKYIPFTYEDREELRVKWIKFKNTNLEYKIIYIGNNYIGIKEHLYTYKELLEMFTFLDGTPCGKLVEE